MIKTILTPLAAVSLIALAACNSTPKTPEVVDTNPDPMAAVLANRAPVELPPAIEADKTLRCKDNSLVYVTFFQGHKRASVRTAKTGPITNLMAAKDGDPLTADGGWKMTGGPDTILITRPGKDEISCKS